MKRLFPLLLLPVLAAGLCQAESYLYSFQSGKASVSGSVVASQAFVDLVEDAWPVGFAYSETLPVKLEQKGKSYVFKGEGLSVKYQPSKRKFTMKASVTDSGESDIVVFTGDPHTAYGGEYMTISKGVMSASGILDEQLDVESWVSLVFDNYRANPAYLMLDLAKKGKKYSFKGLVGADMQYDISLNPGKRQLKVSVKGGPFLGVNSFDSL